MAERWAWVVAAAVGLAGCTPVVAPAPSTPAPSVSRPFTVLTTEQPTTYDPAAATTGADALVALNAFSRLMVVHPAKAELKPDLATDCLYTSPTVYQCELPKGLTFSNGHPLTASDVKFSIERAFRLGVARGSSRLLDSLQRVEAVDDVTVRFTLSFADTQFGYALAAPAASIVDEELYDPDAVRPNAAEPVGSGPFRLVTRSDEALVFEKFENHRGAHGGQLARVRVLFVADSAAAEKAMGEASVDVVWRSLSPAALQRLRAEASADPDRRTKGGFTRVDVPPIRVHRLMWEPSSPHRENAALRNLVALALQADRTLGSLVPSTATGGVDTFGVGGQPGLPTLGGQRVRLTLGYSAKAPGEADLARLIRDRLETAGGLSVQLLPDTGLADLVLSDRTVAVNTTLGWLQDYLASPLATSAGLLTDAVRRARETDDPALRAQLLATVQRQAGYDLTVVPISQSEETLYLGKGVTTEGEVFGPGYQLGLWSLRT